MFFVDLVNLSFPDSLIIYSIERSPEPRLLSRYFAMPKKNVISFIKNYYNNTWLIMKLMLVPDKFFIWSGIDTKNRAFRRVKCRIAESLFVPSNQISYFSFCFVESSFVQWICISIKMNFVLADWNFRLLSFSSLLFLFLQRFSMFFVAIYQFTKWNKCS